MKRTLLIAEDNAFTAMQYKKFLENQGYKVELCNDGQSCWTKFKRELKYRTVVLKDRSPPFDYVLLDHDMPNLSGAEVAERIYNICPKQRICFLSAYGHQIIQLCGIPREDSLQILQKPFSLDFLAKKLEPKTFKIIKRREESELLTATQSPESIR